VYDIVEVPRRQCACVGSSALEQHAHRGGGEVECSGGGRGGGAGLGGE
jgi:hypothetical protein